MKKFITFLIMGLVTLGVSCAEENLTDPGTGGSTPLDKISDYELAFSIEPNNEVVTYNPGSDEGFIRISFTDSSAEVVVPFTDTTTCANIAEDIITNINAYSGNKFTVKATRTDSSGDVELENEMVLTFNVEFIAKSGYEFANPSNDKSITLTVNVDKTATILNADLNFEVTPSDDFGGLVTYERMHIKKGVSSPTTSAPNIPPDDAALATVSSEPTTLTFQDLADSVIDGTIAIIPSDNANKDNFIIEKVDISLDIPTIIPPNRRDRMRFPYIIKAKEGYKFEDGTIEKKVELAMHIYKGPLTTPEE